VSRLLTRIRPGCEGRRVRRHPWARCGAFLVVGLVLVSCGSADDDPSADTSPSGAPSSSSPAASSPAASSPAASPAADIPLVRFRGNGFSVLMPPEPQRVVQEVPGPDGPLKTILWAADGGDQAVIVGYTAGPRGTDVDLSAALEGAANAVGGEIEDEAEATHQGFEARDARITNANNPAGGQMTIFLRVIDARNRLYQLQYIQEGADVTAPPANFAEFQDSLKIT
jgi:hypothetical protein